MPPTLAQPSPLNFSDTSTAFAHKSNADMRRTYWLFKLMNNPALTQLGGKLAQFSLNAGLPVQGIIKATIFKQFVGGTSIKDCLPAVELLGQQGIGSILDYSVEGEKTEAGFDATTAETIATIKQAAGNQHIPFSVFKVTGVAPFALLEKKQAGTALSPSEQQQWERVQQRVHSICEAAYKHHVRLFIDAEETWIQDVIDQLARENMQQFNRQQPIVWNTYQMYRWASISNLEKDLQLAAQGGYFFGAKLVRGAYMEKERARAAKLGYKDPIQPTKATSDADYNAALMLCLDNLHFAAMCAGTHNETSSLLLATEMDKRHIAHNDERIWFSQLFGMSDNISFNLAAAGYNVAKYLPYGPVKSVMPYLLRRANENTSIAGQSSRELGLITQELKRRKK